MGHLLHVKMYHTIVSLFFCMFNIDFPSQKWMQKFFWYHWNFFHFHFQIQICYSIICDNKKLFNVTKEHKPLLLSSKTFWLQAQTRKIVLIHWKASHDYGSLRCNNFTWINLYEFFPSIFYYSQNKTILIAFSKVYDNELVYHFRRGIINNETFHKSKVCCLSSIYIFVCFGL